MYNLEQVRARNAFALSKETALQGKKGGEVIKKVPSLVLNHGLLATAAYSYTESAESWKKLFDAIAQHLADKDIGILEPSQKTRDEMMQALSGPQATSEQLRRATAETLAWLSFARRFVKKDSPEKTTHS